MQSSNSIPYDRNRKRPYENSYDQQGSEAKRQNSKYFLRICVNTKSTGFIIGKAGKNIEMFRSTYGVGAYIAKDLEPYHGIPENFVTLDGPMDGLLGALNDLISFLPRSFDFIPKSHICKELIIPWGDAGKIIGKGGEHVRVLNEKYHTTIRISYDCQPSDKRNRLVLVAAEDEKDVDDAIKEIKLESQACELDNWKGEVTIRIGVPVQAIPLLFPKATTIHPDLKEFENVVIRYCADDETIPGFTTHAVDIHGDAQDVIKAKLKIESLIRQWHTEGRISMTAVTMKFVFNNKIVGVVIGRQGSNLQHMTQAHEVVIRCMNMPCYEGPGMEKVFSISGEPVNIIACVRELLEQMSINHLDRQMPVDEEIYYEYRDNPTSLPAQSGPTEGRGVPVYPQMLPGVQGSVPYPFPMAPYVPSFVGQQAAATSTSQGTQVASQVSPASSVPSQGASQVMSMSPMVPISNTTTQVPSMVPISNTTTQVPSMVPIPQVMSMPPIFTQPTQQPSSLPTDPYPAPFYPFYVPYMPQGKAPSPIPARAFSTSPAPPHIWYTYLSGSPAQGRVTIGLPTDRCGNVLGHRGSNLNFIKASTLCNIQMQQRDRIPRDSLLRAVTITGSEEGIERAVRIMHLFINLTDRDTTKLSLTPFSLNMDLQQYLAMYPEKMSFTSVSYTEKKKQEEPNTTDASEIPEPEKK